MAQLLLVNLEGVLCWDCSTPWRSWLESLCHKNAEERATGIQWVEARGVSKHPTVHWSGRSTIICLAQNVSSAEGDKTSLQYFPDGKTDKQNYENERLWQCSVLVCVCLSAKLLQSRLTLCEPTDQAPLFMGFSRQEYWRGLPRPPPGGLPDPGMVTASLTVPVLQALYHWHHLGSPILAIQLA